MRQKDTRNPLLVFKQIVHVGNDIIHTQLLIFWVLQPNIQYKNGIIHFGNVEVFTIFTYAAQSNQFNIALAHFFSYSIFRTSLLSKILYFITNGPWLAKSNYSLANLRFAYLTYYSIFSCFFKVKRAFLAPSTTKTTSSFTRLEVWFTSLVWEQSVHPRCNWITIFLIYCFYYFL